MSVYQPCDIRGPVADLSTSLYRRWGEALGRQVPRGETMVVGGDRRPSTPDFKQALLEGLLESDIEVADLGIVPTPMVYFARRATRAAGCAIVTASHNPPGVNGLKWLVGELPPTEDDVEQLREEAELADHRVGFPIRGSKISLDVTGEYSNWIAATYQRASDLADLTIVLDPKNGCWAERARLILARLFPKAQVQAIHDRPDGRFPEGNADCSRTRHLLALSRAVQDRGAAVGIAFDGDGDRVAFVDATGRALRAEETTWVLLQSFGDTLCDQAFVYDCKFSDRIPEGAAQLGATPLVERSGHAFIRRRMLESQALFGAEISGHYFYRALRGGDDGLFTACRMIQRIVLIHATLADLRESCPAIYMTPDLRLIVKPDQRDQIIEQLQIAFGRYPQTRIDGVRVDFPDGWGLVRRSVTDSRQLTFRFEGRDRKSLAAVVRRFRDGMPAFGDRLYEAYASNAPEA